jgi:hypothetical protein
MSARPRSELLLIHDTMCSVCMRRHVQVMQGDPKPDAKFTPKQSDRLMVISTNSLAKSYDTTAKPPGELEDTFMSSSQAHLPLDPGTETLDEIIEQRRQVADIYSAVRHLRGGIISQKIGGYSSTTSVEQARAGVGQEDSLTSENSLCRLSGQVRSSQQAERTVPSLREQANGVNMAM